MLLCVHGNNTRRCVLFLVEARMRMRARVAGTKRASSTAVALGSVAQISLNMTMSLSSGLINMLGDQQRDDVSRRSISRQFSADSRVTSSVYDDSLYVDAGLPRCSSVGRRRDSVPAISPRLFKKRWNVNCVSPGLSPTRPKSSAKTDMALVETAGATTQVNEDVSSTTTTNLDSPVNCSGVAIVIEPAAPPIYSSAAGNGSCSRDVTGNQNVSDAKVVFD